jgi:hypothetical protein
VRADIHELIGAIAQRSGLSVAVDDAVDRKISLNLDNVSPDEAIRSISTAYGLALSQSSGMFTLSEGVPTDLATYNASDTQSFRMQNVQASNVSGLLPNFLYSYVKVNSEQNAVVVTAPSQMLAKIGQDLAQMDRPAPQIAVEAIAVELTDATDRDLGISFGDSRNRSFASVDGGTISYNTLGTLPRNFEFNLRALELQGRARVRARPQMAVINGRTGQYLHRCAAFHPDTVHPERANANAHPERGRWCETFRHAADRRQRRNHHAYRARSLQHHRTRFANRPTRFIESPRRNHSARQRWRNHRHRWPEPRSTTDLESQNPILRRFATRWRFVPWQKAQQRAHRTGCLRHAAHFKLGGQRIEYWIGTE